MAVPDWWEERKRWGRTRPSAGGLRAMARAVHSGAEAVSARRLGGGIGTASSLVTLRTRSGRTLEVVLKRFPTNGPDPVLEWERLLFARRLPVPSPEPIALDADGTWFGTAALVMHRLPGRALVVPRRLGTWLDEMARMQIAIHAAPTGRSPRAMRPVEPKPYEPPTGLRHTALVQRAVSYVRPRLRRALARDVVVAHGDNHPGNLLWTRGRITGVTDWAHARCFPRAREVTYMRTEIAVLVGCDAADAYLERYESLFGRRVRDVVLWDIAQGLNGIRYGPMWAHAYREQGARLSDATVRRRARTFVERALARV